MGNSKFVMGVIVLVLAICGSGYWVKASLDKSKQSQAQLAKEHSTEQALLEAKLEEARVRLSAETAQKDLQKLAPLDPKFLIQRLIELEMEKTESDRNYRAFYCLQGLADAGTNALPAIKDFFISGVDTDLELPFFRDPHTLRQEMAAILCGMRTMESAALLSQLLPVTQTATELENLCKVLLEISPETYHSHCVKAARNMYREIIMDQAEKNSAERAKLRRQLADNPDASEELREAYSESSRNADRRMSDIYGIYNLLFRTLKDTEFAHTLMEEGAWMTKSGLSGKEVVNTSLFSRTRELLGEENIQWYHAAFLRMRENEKAAKRTDDRILLNSRSDYSFFEDVALSYAGINPMATDMYLTMLRKENMPTQQYRYRLVSNLENVYDYFATEPTQSFAGERKQSFITARLGLLDTIAAENANDELMHEVINLTRASLQRQSNPDAEPDGELSHKVELENFLTKQIDKMRIREKFEKLLRSDQEDLDEMKKDALETKEK